MARQPTQTPFVRSIQGLAKTAASSRLYLAQTLSARVAQSEFAAAAARRAAEAATAAASLASGAAAAASAAAASAYTQAASAASAAAAAVSAANGANARINVLALTDMFTADGVDAAVGTSVETTIPNMSITQDFGPYPLLVTFSGEVAPDAPSSAVSIVSIGLRTNQRALGLSNRTVVCPSNTSVDTSYEFRPLPGENTVYVTWRVLSGRDVVSPAGRRQLIALRIGTP